MHRLARAAVRLWPSVHADADVCVLYMSFFVKKVLRSSPPNWWVRGRINCRGVLWSYLLAQNPGFDWCYGKGQGLDERPIGDCDKEKHPLCCDIILGGNITSRPSPACYQFFPQKLHLIWATIGVCTVSLIDLTRISGFYDRHAAHALQTDGCGTVACTCSFRFLH